MPQTYCSVPVCKNRGGHKFPGDSVARKLWVGALKRASNKPTEDSSTSWQPGPHDVVCKDHFIESDYIAENYYGRLDVQKSIMQYDSHQQWI